MMNNGSPEQGGGWKQRLFWLIVLAAVIIAWFVFMKMFAVIFDSNIYVMDKNIKFKGFRVIYKLITIAYIFEKFS